MTEEEKTKLLAVINTAWNHWAAAAHHEDCPHYDNYNVDLATHGICEALQMIRNIKTVGEK